MQNQTEPIEYKLDEFYSRSVYIEETDHDRAKNSVFLYSLENGSIEQIEQGLADLTLKSDSTETITIIRELTLVRTKHLVVELAFK